MTDTQEARVSSITARLQYEQRQRQRHLPQPPLLKVAHHVTARWTLDAAVDVVPALARGCAAGRRRLIRPVLVEERLPMAQDAVLCRVEPPCRHTCAS